MKQYRVAVGTVNDRNVLCLLTVSKIPIIMGQTNGAIFRNMMASARG
ncbi:MAG: hypothetical protein JRI95_00975 [Deltaproteobacteria bacterium]|nr:hypothetical protein [Deltaproteobacteria bacterium]MBW2084644.1 hypothetical protein [Deltaproteobacteria bacterium]